MGRLLADAHDRWRGVQHYPADPQSLPPGDRPLTLQKTSSVAGSGWVPTFSGNNQTTALDPKESVDDSESGRWMGSLRMPQRSLRYVGDVRSVRSCGSALELPSERATRSASSLFQPCSPVCMTGRPGQPARSGPSFLSCGTPCSASLKLPLTPVRFSQAKGVGHPRAGAGRDTRCCSAATDQRTGSAPGPWSLGALGHRFV